MGNEMDLLPEVQLYSIGQQEADYAVGLLTADAAAQIRAGDAFGLAIAEEGVVQGAICAAFPEEDKDEILDILSLYIKPEARRRRLGTTLLVELMERTMENTDIGLRWCTLDFMQGTEGMEPLLKDIGFELEPDGNVASWVVSVGELKQSALLNADKGIPQGCSLLALRDCSEYQIRQLVQRLDAEQIRDMSAAEIVNAVPELSYILFDGSGEAKACAIFSLTADSNLCLSQFFTSGGDASAAMTVLRAAADAMKQVVTEDTCVEIPTLTASSAALVKRLAPEARKIPLIRAYYDMTQI